MTMSEKEKVIDGPIMLVLKNGQVYKTDKLTITGKKISFPLEKITKVASVQDDAFVLELDDVDFKISEGEKDE